MTVRSEIAGSPVLVNAEPGETILAALLRHGVPFTYSCLSGNCGTCKCTVLERPDAAIFELARSENTLTSAERAAGVVLACRSEVLGPLKIRLPGIGGV